MSYVALYRKFRPQTFSQVKGQDHVVRTLKNQIRNHRIGHAYLFTGTRGTGKTSVAKIFAKAVNCLHPKDGEPCNECGNCLAANADAFMDVVEIDAASNTGVDDIRRVIEEIQYTPVKGRYKVYIIDEAHMLSTSAFNAFLKTLEEPPAYAVFILATTEPHKLPITILSRCQRYDFHRISNAVIAANLAELTAQEGVEAEAGALNYIARMGDGSMRDSISLLDKCVAFNLGEKLTYENVLATLGTVDTDVFSRVFRAVASGDTKSALEEIGTAVREGKDLGQFVTDFIWYLRNLLLIHAGSATDEETLGVSAESMKALRSDAALVPEEVLMRYIRILSELLNRLRFSATKQILVEVAFIKLSRPEMEKDTESLADRIRQLEEREAMTVPVRKAALQREARTMRKETEQQEAETVRTEPPVMPAPQVPLEMTRPEPEEGYRHLPPKPISPAQLARYSWGDIVSACGNIRLRTVLKKAVPRIGADDQLLLYSESEISQKTLKEEQAEIESLISRVCGKDVHLQVRSGAAPAETEEAPPQRPEPADLPKDLFANINFEIGTEDE